VLLCGYAFLPTAIGTIRHQGVDVPPPDTIEGLLYALPEERCIVDACRPATALADAPPAARVSPWFGYSPLDPAHVPRADGIEFVKDARRSWFTSAAAPVVGLGCVRSPPGSRSARWSRAGPVARRT
jgi:hypothetical protein